MAASFNGQLTVQTRVIQLNGLIDDIAIAGNVANLFAPMPFDKSLQMIGGRRVGDNSGAGMFFK